LNKPDKDNLTLRAGNAVYGGLTVTRRPNQESSNGHPDKTVLVKGAIPGELIEISITGEKRNHITGDIAKVLEPSPDRIEPRCVYFGTCGGCQLQFAAYNQQIKMKESALLDCMKRIAKIDTSLSEALAIKTNNWGYRHRGRFKVSGQTIGFSREKSNSLVEIEQCPLMTADINNALSALRKVIADRPQIFKYIDEICLVSNSASELWQENVAISFLGKPAASNKTGIRPINASSNKTCARKNSINCNMARSHTNNTSNSTAGICADTIGELKSVLSEYGLTRIVFPDHEPNYEDHDKIQNQEFDHDNSFELPLNGTSYRLRYKVSPNGFFQANWKLNLMMIDKVIDSLRPLENKVVLDIFSGAGNFSLPVALTAKDVIAVEANPAAIFYGKLNARLNNIGNVEFHNISSQRLSKKHFKNVDAVIMDPPRSGIGNNVAKLLLENRISTVVYVSCDPATLARDLSLLSQAYAIDSLRLVDMFPQTYHIESLAILKAKH
jgi:23S rRNA (uracil1939-C5)-methyltransferase